MRNVLTRFRSDASGQGLVEYVLVIALIAVGLALVMLVFRDSLGNMFDATTSTLNESVPGGCKNPMPQKQNPNC